MLFGLSAVCHATSAIEVTDVTGRRLRFETPPQRIVALAPSITEVVFALGRGDRLAAVTRYSDYPPEARTLPKVGSYINLSLEKILAAKPDICIATRDGNPKAVVDRLTDLGVPVYITHPTNLDAVMATIGEIGRLLDAEANAAAVVAKMESRIETVQRRIAGASRLPRVFVQIGISPIVAAGGNTFIDELIRLAGGVNIAGGDVQYPKLSREKVLARMPEVIVITSMARSRSFEAVKSGWAAHKEIPAARDGRIHLVDSDIFDRPTPRLADGLAVLARLIHPDRFEDELPASGNSLPEEESRTR